MTSAYSEILKRIEAAIGDARAIFARFTPGAIDAEYKAGHDPVTEADRAVDAVLRQNLLRDGEGWLSEESVDDLSRLDKVERLGRRSSRWNARICKGHPGVLCLDWLRREWSPVAGGIHNPATNETFVGAIDTGVLYNGKPASVSPRKDLQGAVTLASRSEVKRGEWKPFENGPLEVRAMGSVAYKLALVSAGLADITFTLTPKNEWDVAAGAALVSSSGGFLATLNGSSFRANNRDPLLSGLVASGPNLREGLLKLLEPHLQAAAVQRVAK